MKVIKDSPEHHFLTMLEKLKQDSSGWVGLHFALSGKINHAAVIDKPEHIKGKLHKLYQQSDALVKELAEAGQKLVEATFYIFTDSDIVLLARPQNKAEMDLIQKLLEKAAEKIGAKLCSKSNLAKDIYGYQKLADKRFLAARRVEAYRAMADTNRVQSIPLRKQRHEDAMIMIVEDDRFTASYAANILNKEYDIVVAKTGEEAIDLYVEYAPDLVLLDIHLPGLSGHETLHAIRKIDQGAYVVMLSVDTVKHNIVAATKGGAASFIKKPFSKERLTAVIEKAPCIAEKKARKSGAIRR